MSSLSFRSSVTVVKGDRSRERKMSDFGGDDVRELAYEDAPHDMEACEIDEDVVENAEVLQESDVDGFRKTPSRNDRFSSSSFIEEERAVMVDKPYEIEVKTARSESSEGEEEEVEERKYQAPPARPTKIEDILPARDENQNHSHGTPDEDMGSAKKAFAQYEAALKKTSEEQKKADDDAERAELAKKKKVSDLISRFNTGAAYNQSSGNANANKGDYGVGRGGKVDTGRFK